jgi:hypothetical protein
LAFQKGFTQAPGDAARGLGGQSTKERAPSRHPGQGPLQHSHEQVALTQLAHDQGGEGPIHGEIGTEQDAGDLDGLGVDDLTARHRRNAQDRNRLANEGERGADALQALLARFNREVTDLTP